MGAEIEIPISSNEKQAKSGRVRKRFPELLQARYLNGVGPQSFSHNMNFHLLRSQKAGFKRFSMRRYWQVFKDSSPTIVNNYDTKIRLQLTSGMQGGQVVNEGKISEKKIGISSRPIPRLSDGGCNCTINPIQTAVRDN